MRVKLFENYKPTGTGWIALIGLGLLITYLVVTLTSDNTSQFPSDPDSQAAIAQATEILNLAEAGDETNELNQHLELVIADYRIVDQRFETRFDVSITAEQLASRGSLHCLTLELNVEENTLTLINILELDECLI